MVTYNVKQGRHNDDPKPKQDDLYRSMGQLHHKSFPKAKKPLDVNNHEHDNNPMTEHEHGTALSTEHHSKDPVNKSLYHLNKGQYKGTTVTNKTTYHG